MTLANLTKAAVMDPFLLFDGTVLVANHLIPNARFVWYRLTPVLFGYYVE